jgi:hypothetical protein
MEHQFVCLGVEQFDKTAHGLRPAQGGNGDFRENRL